MMSESLADHDWPCWLVTIDARDHEHWMPMSSLEVGEHLGALWVRRFPNDIVMLHEGDR